jgi:phospholipid/cholesterol/gamma-HCH transport system substrate-binding protein
MATHSPKFKVRLGLFIIVGLAFFVLAIFVIGKQKNLFDPVFTLHTRFNNVSGLQVGNTVRFSGINVGTVDNIQIVNDSTVQVTMLLKKDVQRFIKNDSQASIGSEGIIGDRILVISNAGQSTKSVRDGQLLASSEPEILAKINNGNGTLGRLINDEKIAKNIDQTIVNLKSSTKGLDENMEAAKHNFLLRGYFKKKEKEAEKKKKEAEKKTKEDAEKKKEADEKAKKEADNKKKEDADKSK